MTDETFIIGVDGGGTSTVARLAGREGNIISAANAGPSNLQALGYEKCAQLLTDLVVDCTAGASVPLDNVEIVVFGTAGAGRKTDRERLYNAIISRWKDLSQRPRSLHVVSDADLALEAAYGDKPGLVLIAGTGSILYGRDVDNTIKRYGGWGPVIGDPGSGSAIGIRALRFAAKTIDGNMTGGELMRLITGETGIRSHESLINKVYSKKYSPALLAPLVVRAASQGDTAAKEIMSECALELVDLVRCGIKKFSFTNVIPVSFSGGLLQSGSTYAKVVSKMLREKLPAVDIRDPVSEPVKGAVMMALRYLQKR